MRLWHQLTALTVAFTAAAPAMAQDLVVYSGRSRSLVEPLVEKFEQQTGLDVQTKFGRGAQLLQTLKEEGQLSPTDVFWANTAGTLGAASDLLAELPTSVRDQAEAYRPSSGRWTPVTARFRVLAYNPEEVDPADLPDSVLELAEMDQFEGRFGWTPTYSSFHDFVTALRLTEGRAAAGQWLAEVQSSLDPNAYPSNTPMLEAMTAGDIDLALTNHYYVHRMRGNNPDAPVDIYHFAPGDVGNLALVTGAGVLKTSDSQETAHRFLEFLLSDEAQQYAAEQVNEYPVRSEVTLPDHLLPTDEVLELSPQFDFEQLHELEPTLDLLREEGLL